MGNSKSETSRQINDATARGTEPRYAAICTVSVIIPTKNRPRDLSLVIQSLFEQTVRVNEVIIVDQSESDEGRILVQSQFDEAREGRNSDVELRYIQDRSISGGAEARNYAMQVATGEIWLFLDDDVYLEPDFVERLLRAYDADPRATGVSGIITNYSAPPWGFRLWSGLFERGPFRDERQPIYWNADRLRNSKAIRVQRFGGGLMSFRADAIKGLRFDENLRGVCDGEDVDFCMQMKPRNPCLLIAPGARLIHNQSLSGRLQDHWVRRQSRATVFLYNKHWRGGIKNRLCFFWLLTGYAAVVSFSSLRRGSFDPWRAFREGVREGRVAG